MNDGTPKTYRGASTNALDELSRPGTKPPADKDLREFVVDVFYSHNMDRLRNDFATAIVNRESAETLWERIKTRENL